MSSKRQIILDTALTLFCQQGFHATGIDLILKKAGVAKMTMYHHFPSKEMLIQNVLQELSERHFLSYRDALFAAGLTAEERLASVFQPLHLLPGFAEEFPGCPFVKAASEFPESDDPIHQQAVTYKQRFLTLFSELAKEAGYAHADGLGRAIQLLLDGLMVLTPLRRDPKDMAAAEQALSHLLHHWPRSAFKP